jgi:hypothetical protein
MFRNIRRNKKPVEIPDPLPPVRYVASAASVRLYCCEARQYVVQSSCVIAQNNRNISQKGNRHNNQSSHHRQLRFYLSIVPNLIPPQLYLMADLPWGQEQSLLFSNLSLDTRLLIYEAAFSIDRLLHIVWNHGICLGTIGNRRRGQRIYGLGGMDYWHCIEPDSPFPTWQHVCYGVYKAEDGRGYYTRNHSRSNSDLVLLLSVCRKT